MIVTVTLNPAVDKIIKIDRLNPGSLNRVKEVVNMVGGKGINVAKVVHHLGYKVMPVSILGGERGKEIYNSLNMDGINQEVVWAEHETRQNLKIVEVETGRETEVNEPGRASIKDLKSLIKKLENVLEHVNLLVLAGSIPEGLPADTYNQLIRLADKYNVRTILDTAEENLVKGLKGKPFLIKPNIEEAEFITGYKIRDNNDIYKAINYFLDKGIEIVVISLGNKGAVFANKKECIKVRVPEVRVKNTTVGAGDSLVAGLSIKLLNTCNLEKLASFSTAVATTFVKKADISKINKREIEQIQSRIILEYM